ncbi:protein-disulfide reductase DsbD domain-containing protein [Sinorhizobium psoraleae]|uniref:Protein-disulfide reductase DsbD family protein n=1 Tax=Sinorhizobium psoraleae TaxID=520838 RepID=A0ABT4KAA5_9HYPH|nr:protein-disulfide reductase DsbD domain-containing protein [Sinorhizobium psoraleae]MCZ4088783.1 protein-disulfide reductase DsbD family protein [Sinorhizobium psoraleae]
MLRASLLTLIWVLIAAILPARAFEAPLPMDDAFVPSIAKEKDGLLTITWKIADGYYLYRDYLSAKGGDDQPLALQTDSGKIKHDPGFGKTEVYYGQASASIAKAPWQVRLTYQGCQEGGLCYPPTTRAIDVAAMTIETPGGAV